MTSLSSNLNTDYICYLKDDNFNAKPYVYYGTDIPIPSFVIADSHLDENQSKKRKEIGGEPTELKIEQFANTVSQYMDFEYKLPEEDHTYDVDKIDDTIIVDTTNDTNAQEYDELIAFINEDLEEEKKEEEAINYDIVEELNI